MVVLVRTQDFLARMSVSRNYLEMDGTGWIFFVVLLDGERAGSPARWVWGHCTWSIVQNVRFVGNDAEVFFLRWKDRHRNDLSVIEIKSKTRSGRGTTME